MTSTEPAGWMQQSRTHMMRGVASLHYEMSLRPGPFGMIADGRKRYELRLNDEKRRKIRVGDTIGFTCTADGRMVETVVTSLQSFVSFADLYTQLPLLECGYTVENVSTADPRDMEKYYPAEKQYEYGVLAIGLERIRLAIDRLSGPYTVRALDSMDVPQMLKVARSNPLFYRYMKPGPTEENLLADLTALPPGRTLADKHFFGWFDGDELIAMMDLIWKYPKPEMAFIGWFIVAGRCQGRCLGRRLIRDVLALLREQGVAQVRLGMIQGNPQSRHFWHVCGFEETGLISEEKDYRVVIMAKTL